MPTTNYTLFVKEHFKRYKMPNDERVTVCLNALKASLLALTEKYKQVDVKTFCYVINVYSLEPGSKVYKQYAGDLIGACLDKGQGKTATFILGQVAVIQGLMYEPNLYRKWFPELSEEELSPLRATVSSLIGDILKDIRKQWTNKASTLSKKYLVVSQKDRNRMIRRGMINKANNLLIKASQENKRARRGEPSSNECD